jgi:hypothetical protein
LRNDNSSRFVSSMFFVWNITVFFTL